MNAQQRARRAHVNTKMIIVLSVMVLASGGLYFMRSSGDSVMKIDPNASELMYRFKCMKCRYSEEKSASETDAMEQSEETGLYTCPKCNAPQYARERKSGSTALMP